MFKKGAGVIDFGCGIDSEGKITVDLDSKNISRINLYFYTPTPGGTGPILVACLIKNFYILANDDV